MATYAQRPDGLLEVELDDGRIVPTALDPSLLEAQGITPKPPPSPVMTKGTAGLDVQGMNTRPGLPGSEGLGASPAFGQLMGAGAPQRLDAPPSPIGPPKPPPIPEQPGLMSTMPEPGMSREQEPQPQAGAAPAEPRGDLAREMSARYLQSLLSQRGSPGALVKGGDRRAGYQLKYADIPTDPQLEEDISETRIDQQLARQESADQTEYAKAMQARVASQAAEDAQRQLERTIARKGQIDQEVGRRIEGIEARFAKARAVTESGSARERVMRDKGSFGRILAAIGMALGDWAAITSGTGRNFAREQIDKEVAEEMEREKQLYNVDPEMSALKAYVDAWGTPQQALKEMELNKREAVQAQMEAWIRRADAASVPIEFKNWLNDQGLQVLEEKRKLLQAAATDVVESWQNVPDRVVGGSASLSPEKAAEKAAKLAESLRTIEGKGKDSVANQASIRKFHEQGVIQLPEGGYAYHPVADTAVKIEKALHTIPSWRANLRQMADIYDARGGVSSAAKLNPEDRARLEVLAVQSFDGMKAVAEEAMTSGEDETFWKKLRGANTQEFVRWASDKASLQQAISATEQFERNRRSRLRRLPPELDPGTLPGPLVPPRPPSFRERK